MFPRSAILALALVAAANANCPSTSLTFDDWIGNRGGTDGACSSNAQCTGFSGDTSGDSMCCVHFTFPYCGVPSSCNQYLNCVSDAPIPEPMGADDPDKPTDEEFQTAMARAGGGGAYYDGCPPTSETWDSYQAKGGRCTSNSGCAASNAGACCVKYTFSYCGVPSDCNDYLQCMSDAEEAAASVSLASTEPPVEPGTEEFKAALEGLTGCTDATSVDEIEMCVRDNVANMGGDPTSASTTKAVSFVIAALAGFGALVY